MRHHPFSFFQPFSGLSALVLAASLAAYTPLAVAQANPVDEEWGCTLLLCFAHPGGPMAAPACKPPVLRLLTEMAKFWKRFRVPGCLGAESKGSRLDLRPAAYNNCSPGMQALQAGAKVVITTPEQAQIWQNSDTRVWIGRLAADLPPEVGTQWRHRQDSGIGEGDEELQAALNERRPARNKLCVGGPLGAAQLPYSTVDERGHLSDFVDEIQTVYLFERIETIEPPDGSLHYQVLVDYKPFTSGTLKP